ncbi:glycosyl hydrolase 43 family protein [Sphingobacterium alkalisoli]|uniref:Glycosyl hydrolase 43 family protein n=1 Tax=Sphingobacterium alkalisoli TaxID=1874115 RepID=A0A4U0H520_9SPHI|nr:glycoside hydrolase 43 family protein [Sphingobacterium alkalisoli]TJY66821.1 glycosyl hydrolase 43 family protein [Sphingobacterium alkalisoli]GGH14008.1 glycoside hydrolase [Sphingobacterium alkalisoli]
MKINLLLSSIFLLVTGTVFSQNYVSSVWSPDLGNGKYKNPIIDADYSDPDVTRVGDDYYMISSSFNHTPGLPVLHSKDMINWKIIGHALQRQVPEGVFNKVQHGNGVWAPAIRFHKGEFYIYYPDPDYGIYMTRTKDPAGAWSDPILVFEGKGLIDPCPFWDDDGKNYLAFAYAGSRAGLKSVLAIAKLNEMGDKVLDRGVIVYDGHVIDPTIEGPKIHKRNGYYYLFAPSGGVATGWQLVLRSKHVYGPYERKVVMEQGNTAINGPHQGAWVDTPSGEDWFFHFQDKEAMGRVVHLQPMKWINDWPVIGEDKDGDGTGNPVLEYKKPNVGKSYPIVNPMESDEFETSLLGLQWQWQANPDGTWLIPSHNGHLRLYTQEIPADFKNMLDVPNILTQKMPAENFKATTKIRLVANEKDLKEKAGFIVVGEDYSQLYIAGTADQYALFQGICKRGLSGKTEEVSQVAAIDSDFIYLQVRVTDGTNCNWYYSLDNEEFKKVGETFSAKPGKWIGATLGLYATREQTINDSGFAEVDWFRIEKL